VFPKGLRDRAEINEQAPKPPKTDEQREAERRRNEFADKLELIAEYLGEDDFVSAVKG
jgi:hypothetical protein